MNLGREVGRFPDPQEQMEMMKRSINGVNISDYMDARDARQNERVQYQPSQNNEDARIRGIVDMVESGELVHRNQIPNPVIQQQPYQAMNNSQTSVSAQGMISNAEVGNNNIMNELFGISNANGNGSNGANAQNMGMQNVQSTTQGSPVQQPGYDDIMREQLNVFSQESVRHGIKPDELINFVSQLTPSDYISLYKAGSQQAKPNRANLGPSVANMGNMSGGRSVFTPQQLRIEDINI